MTSTTTGTTTNEDRFSRLEDPASDFPFYNGVPTPISNRQWLFVVAMVVIGFLMMVLPIPWPSDTFKQFSPAILMPAIPLLALAYVAPGHWKSIFGKVGGREVKLMFGFALLNFVVSMSVGTTLTALTEVTSNASTSQLGDLDLAGRLAFFAKTIPQLFGEEVITLLPFLAVLQWCSKCLGMGRKGAIICAWVITSVVFGLIHLPTYDWNWIQCIVVIGSARMVLTLPWILTKNIWVSTGAHIVNDWLLFLMALLGAGLVGKV
jgi:uncharacterized protein